MTNPTIPWQERPQDSEDVIWRYEHNPIIGRHSIPSSNSIFNSAVVKYGDGFAGVFRCDDRNVRMNIHAGFSEDGITWDIEHAPINMKSYNGQELVSEYKYDPRVTYIDDRYWVTWCNGYHGPTIGVAYTFDFKEFVQMENAFLPYNRNGVLFPEKINNQYVMLSRPSDTGHTAFGDMFLSYSPDMIYWGKHRLMMKPTPFELSAWQCTKIGAGPVPIRINEGWLILYHGVITTCNGFRYSMGGAVVDYENPAKVLYRCGRYLLAPAELYELTGDVPNVIFPCASLEENDKISIYYGAADTTVCLCFGYISEIVDYIKKYNIESK